MDGEQHRDNEPVTKAPAPNSTMPTGEAKQAAQVFDYHEQHLLIEIEQSRLNLRRAELQLQDYRRGKADGDPNSRALADARGLTGYYNRGAAGL